MACPITPHYILSTLPIGIIIRYPGKLSSISGHALALDAIITVYLRPFFSLPLIQKEQLSVKGVRVVRMCTPYW